MNGCEKSYTHPSSLRKHMKSHGKHYPHLLKCSTSSSFMDYQKDCNTPPPQGKRLNGSMVHSAESGFDEDSKSNLSSSPLAITSADGPSTTQSINYTPSLMMRSNPSLLLNSNSSSSNNYGQLLSTAASEYAASGTGCLTPHSAYPTVSSATTVLSDWRKQMPSMPTPPSNGSSPTSSSTQHLNSNHHSSLSHHPHLNSMSFNSQLNYMPSHFHAASY